jgi:two-component system nitrate/nitrite response regulator NarL
LRFSTLSRPDAGSNIGAKGEVKVLVSNGEQVPLAPDLGSKSRNQPKLSERELSILDGIVRGYQNKMIARACGITEATVKVHMKSILRKIRVGNRTQAAVVCISST